MIDELDIENKPTYSAKTVKRLLDEQAERFKVRQVVGKRPDGSLYMLAIYRQYHDTIEVVMP